MPKLMTTIVVNEKPKNYKKHIYIPKYIPESAKEAFRRPAYYCGAPKTKEEEYIEEFGYEDDEIIEEDEEIDENAPDTFANLGMDEKDFY